MLAEIFCKEFHQKRIIFNDELNVVLGTNSGDNSIGKSTFLLIVDFVFGGNTYAKSNDIINNVGKHNIYFKFIFRHNSYYFCRCNTESDIVWVCDEKWERLNSLKITEYCLWLSKQYNIDFPFLSFRDAVGRYIRVYGKENYDEKHPLHYISSESDNKTMIALLKLFNLYDKIERKEKQFINSKEAYNVYKKARDMLYISKINKSQYKKNESEIKRLNLEIQVLSSDLEHGLLDVDAIASERAIDIKTNLSRAKRIRSSLYNKLNTIDENGNYKFLGATSSYNQLLKFFPQANIKHIEEIESFHKKISSVFKSQLASERRNIVSKISEYNLIISEYEQQLKELIQNPNLSKIVLQNHAEKLKCIDKMTKENQNYLKHEELRKQKELDYDEYQNIKIKQLSIIENLLNEKMKEINDLIYQGKNFEPTIHFSDTNYQFVTPNDTGTGIAYKGLVVFDLSMLNLTKLPIIVHDSIVLKQISDSAIENIMYQYLNCGKQIIIALDKQNSYTKNTLDILTENCILKLDTNGKELFGRSWGIKE